MLKNRDKSKTRPLGGKDEKPLNPGVMETVIRRRFFRDVLVSLCNLSKIPKQVVLQVFEVQ